MAEVPIAPLRTLSNPQESSHSGYQGVEHIAYMAIDEVAEVIPIKDTSSSSSSASEAEEAESSLVSSTPASPPHITDIRQELRLKRRVQSIQISKALASPTGKKIIFEYDEEDNIVKFPKLKGKANAKTSTDPKVNSDLVETRLQEIRRDLDILKVDLAYLTNDLKIKIDVLVVNMETMKEFFDMTLNLSIYSSFEALRRHASISASFVPLVHDDWVRLLTATEGFKIKEREATYQKLQTIQEEKKQKVILDWVTADRDRLRAENAKQRRQLMEAARRGYLDLAPSGSEDDGMNADEPAEDDPHAHPPAADNQDPPADSSAE